MTRLTLQAIFEARERRRQADAERAAQHRQLAVTLRECRQVAGQLGLGFVVGFGGLGMIYAALVLAALLHK